MNDDVRETDVDGEPAPDEDGDEEIATYEDGDGEPWSEDPDLPPDPVHPGDPSAENVAFVVLGALVALFVLARIAGLV